MTEIVNNPKSLGYRKCCFVSLKVLQLRKAFLTHKWSFSGMNSLMNLKSTQTTLNKNEIKCFFFNVKYRNPDFKFTLISYFLDYLCHHS